MNKKTKMKNYYDANEIADMQFDTVEDVTNFYDELMS